MGQNPYNPVDHTDFNSFMRDMPARTSTPLKKALPTQIYQQTLNSLEYLPDHPRHILCMVHHLPLEEDEISHPNHQEDMQDSSHHLNHPHLHHLRMKEVTLPEEQGSDLDALNLMITCNHHLEDMEEDPQEEEVEEVEEEEDHPDHSNQVP